MSTTIGGIQAYGASQAVGSTDFRTARQQALGAAGTLLGLSQQDLKTALQSGKSLADLARQKGLSEQDLVSTVARSLAASACAAGQPAAQNVNALAQRIVEHKGGHHHGGGMKPLGAVGAASDPDGDGDGSTSTGGSTVASPLSRLASALGLDPSTLLSTLQSAGGQGSATGGSTLLSYGLSGQLGQGLQGLAVDTTA